MVGGGTSVLKRSPISPAVESTGGKVIVKTTPSIGGHPAMSYNSLLRKQ
jgi:hypothetical protein